MQNLLNSRISLGNNSPIKLAALSPDKFGKAAYADLCYTPSKLADNVLYREVTTLRKVQGSNNKLRQFEVLNSFFKERLKQLEDERDGIEQSLNQQISMYKKMLHQMEANHEIRIRNIQKGFNQEIKVILDGKEEEAKYAQSQKQLLQGRIEQLEANIQDLTDRLNNSASLYNQLNNSHEKLEIEYRHLAERLKETQRKAEKDLKQAHQQRNALENAMKRQQQRSKNEFQQAMQEKNRQLQSMEKNYRTELEKLDSQRIQENLMKSQELKDLTNAFETECKRLNETVAMKQRLIESLGKENAKDKDRILELTKSYQGQLGTLIHEKVSLSDKIQQLLMQRDDLESALERQRSLSKQEKNGLKLLVSDLKEELKLNQMNFIRQRDQHEFSKHLSLEERMSSQEKSKMQMEILNLRELLFESSQEMENCKSEFLRSKMEKEELLVKIQQLCRQIEFAKKSKNVLESEVLRWRNVLYPYQRNS